MVDELQEADTSDSDTSETSALLENNDDMAFSGGISGGEGDDDDDDDDDDEVPVADVIENKDWDPATYEALLELLHIKEQHKLSNKCFQDILKWSNRQRSDQSDSSQFPESLPAVQRLLEDAGCTPPRVYYICLHEDHPCHYDILDTDTASCRYCDRPGSVKYYYMSLSSKVKAWVKQKSMCRKMLAHWKECDHWLQREREVSNSDSWGYPYKKEVWDGTRFEELSYFWDQEKVQENSIVAHTFRWWPCPFFISPVYCNYVYATQLSVASLVPNLYHQHVHKKILSCHKTVTTYDKTKENTGPFSHLFHHQQTLHSSYT